MAASPDPDDRLPTAKDERNLKELEIWYHNDTEVKQSIENLKTLTQEGMERLEKISESVHEKLEETTHLLEQNGQLFEKAIQEESKNIKDHIGEELKTTTQNVECLVQAESQEIKGELKTITQNVESVVQEEAKGIKDKLDVATQSIDALRPTAGSSQAAGVQIRLRMDCKAISTSAPRGRVPEKATTLREKQPCLQSAIVVPVLSHKQQASPTAVSGVETVTNAGRSYEQRIMSSIADRYIQAVNPSTAEEFVQYLRDLRNVLVEDTQEGSRQYSVQSAVSSVEDCQDVSSSGVVSSEGGSVSVKGVKLTCPPGAVDDPVTIKLKMEEPHKYCVSLVEDCQDVRSSGVVSSEGGSVSVKGVKLTCPPGAVDDPVTIKLKMEEPHKYCGLLVHHGLENDVMFYTPIINCQPNGQIFKKCVTLTIALDIEKEKSTDHLLVLHGTPTAEGRIIWEDATHNSKLDLVKNELKVEITRFSIIAVLLRLCIQAKQIATRLNLISFKYTLSVLFKSKDQHSPYDELALIFMSQDIYQEEFYREHDDSALVQLKRDGFEELGSKSGHERNFIYNKETLVVSIHLGEDYKPVNNQQECITFAVDSSIWWSTGHVVKLPLQGSSADVKVMCGRINIQGQYGHVREEHFCQMDLCGYVRRLLGVENVIFNLKPVALKLELPEEMLNQFVACWQSEAEQLEMILQLWRETQEDTEDLAVFTKALKRLDSEEYRVKERGQMHIEHLRELAVIIEGLQHNDPNMMKYLGKEIKKLCNSVLRDCCIEIATSKDDLDLAPSMENCVSFLVFHRQISEDFAKNYKQMYLCPEESITGNFLIIVASFVQIIKEIFREEKIPQIQSGLRGVAEESTIQTLSSNVQEAAQNKRIFSLFTEVCNILENLCLNNNHSRTTEDEIHKWNGSANIFAMLNFLDKFFQCCEARRLRKRLEVFSVSLKDIMSNPAAFEGNFLRDFQNVAVSLLKFAKFDPSQLVRFELIDPTNSSRTQGHDGLKYDKSQETFSQLFRIKRESEDELQLKAVAHVHINGHIRSIGSFESLITLPASCSEAIDRIPIDSLSVAVEKEYDDSGNLRVTLYSTQKEKVRKALQHLENELEGDVAGLKRAEIAQSHLKVISLATAGTVVRLRLVHKWGSETLVLDSNDFVSLADSSAGGACVPDSEIAAEVNQLAIRNKLPALPIASDSNVGNCSSNFVMDPSDAELRQRHLHEQRGRIEIHYHQTFQRGHVCVAGENTSLNMQMPDTRQRFLEAGPSAAPQRSITAETGADEV